MAYLDEHGLATFKGKIDEQINGIKAMIPNPPTTDGSYILTVTITNGVPVYSWTTAT